jgi:hypothetical protein
MSFPFHNQQSPSTSPILDHPFPLPLLSPFLCTPPSRGMLSPTLGQSYFSTRLPRNVGLNIIMPKQHPAPLKVRHHVSFDAAHCLIIYTELFKERYWYCGSSTNPPSSSSKRRSNSLYYS